ncbi:tuberous sclerosis 2 protein [Rhypophila decipiens]|uniref:Tuberous sclerosis 2 protein n=1 Tax=Rhypophila decipiens TaxID=261697 RepID=A0AAN7B672_9PEZI|nr:tuberous sclerosis 2 protein [Rhypophila decipiens]
MLRRLASLGHQAADDQEPMSPSPGDDSHSHQARGTGGLAGVFKGLTGSKLTKSPPPTSQPPTPITTISQQLSDRPDAVSPTQPTPVAPAIRGIPQDQLELFNRLRSGTINERVDAAGSLRYAISDYPLDPIREVWFAGKDLIDSAKHTDARVAGWGLLTACVKATPSTDRERHEYFQTLTAPANPEDFHLQLAAIVDLTNHGRNVAGFADEIFPLLTSWLYEAYIAVRSARRHARGGNKTTKGKIVPTGEDNNFSQLFAFVKDVIKFNFKHASDAVVGRLMDNLLRICMNTSVEEDLRSCINVIDALVTFGSIPNGKLKDCMQVLSSIHCMVPSLQKDSWHTISDICKSHHGQSTMRLLLDVLRTVSMGAGKERNKDTVREVRGALSVLKKLLSKSTEKGYPAVPLALLLDGLANISASAPARIAADVLKLVNSLFEGSDGKVNPLLAEEHWEPIFSVVVQCVEKGMSSGGADMDGASIKTVSTTNDDLESDDNISNQARILVTRVEQLVAQNQSDSVQREQCIHFFTHMRHALPDSTAMLVLEHFKTYQSCLPSQVDWKESLQLVVKEFYLDQDRPPLVRLRALEVIVETYNFLTLVPDLVGETAVGGLIEPILSKMGEELDTLVLQDTVDFLVNVAETSTVPIFDKIMEAFKSVVSSDMDRARLAYASTPKPEAHPIDQSGYLANQSLSNVVIRGYVQTFIRAMNRDASKSTKVFNALVRIAGSNACEIDARLTAMKLLFRIRADFDHHIYLTTHCETEALAASLYRTEASLARKLAEDAAQPQRLSRADHAAVSRTSRGISFTQGQTGDRGHPGRSTHTPKPAVHQGLRLWSLPELDALPEEPPSEPSPRLLSCRKDTGEDTKSQGPSKTVLNISSWLKALLNLFHEGCDWEIYSFMLVHLPSQLCNQPVFESDGAHIQELRQVLCEMLRMNSFQEPPSSSGLRRPDVANCLFHALAITLSYHRYFQKQDEDEIVRTFIAGITDKTAKTCIHALSVCCHELSSSVSKALVTILQKMSMVITQPLVAMHILEFLACLSRLPALYANFREEEFRIVFGICFRYLQYVRDKKHSARNSHASEPSTPSAGSGSQLDLPGHQSSTDDLPQYVYALAYHVITFWFLAVKMPDRPNLVGWIAKNLFTDVDGTASNEEQAQVTLDFMQRVAYSDASDSAEDPLFNEQLFGDLHRKRWIIGNSIVTIKQSKETGWAEITRRYPSGTSSFAVRVEFAPLPAPQAPEGSDSALWNGRFQQGVTIAPSHLLIQLVCPMPQIYDPTLRPIPLADEDAVERAIRTFDRNSTVDGHKVGVIYIGEGQTKEGEILANTIGGPAYLEFLRGLGVLTELKGATFNTQGLDRENDIDGRYTYCWRDRVTEIVFHVTTMMPTRLENDPQCVMKKRHIGNDFVNIIFNDSGLPFKFDTFPSQFNYVYIVITPTPSRPPVALRENCTAKQEESGGLSSSPFFMVQVMSQQGFPEISPAAEPKIISLKALSSFVRLLALNASVFSHVWANREGGEHVGSWRNRLREINRLRERYGPKVAPSPPPSSVGGGSTTVGGGGSNIPTGLYMTQIQSPVQQGNDSSRPASSIIRDSLYNRRSSVATFVTSTSADQASHRSSMLSTATTDNTEIFQLNGADALVDSVDFSKWT